MNYFKFPGNRHTWYYINYKKESTAHSVQRNSPLFLRGSFLQVICVWTALEAAVWPAELRAVLFAVQYYKDSVSFWGRGWTHGIALTKDWSSLAWGSSGLLNPWPVQCLRDLFQTSVPSPGDPGGSERTWTLNSCCLHDPFFLLSFFSIHGSMVA